MPIDDQLKMQILLGDFDRDGKDGRRPPRRRKATGGGFIIAGAFAIAVLLGVVAALF